MFLFKGGRFWKKIAIKINSMRTVRVSKLKKDFNMNFKTADFKKINSNKESLINKQHKSTRSLTMYDNILHNQKFLLKDLQTIILASLKSYEDIQNSMIVKSDTLDILPYNFLLTVNFKKRSLYIGLNSNKGRCIFSYTSGMFLPNYKSHIIPKELRKRHLKILRSLKHKEKKLVKKKTKVLRWKCERYASSTRMYMLRYISRLLAYIRFGSFLILIRGIPRGLIKVLKTLFLGKRGGVKRRGIIHINYLIFMNKFEHVMTTRAIKKRIQKRMTKH